MGFVCIGFRSLHIMPHYNTQPYGLYSGWLCASRAYEKLGAYARYIIVMMELSHVNA